MFEKLKNNTDVILKETEANLTICYQEQLCNILAFMKDFYPRLEEHKNVSIELLFPGICKKIEGSLEQVEQMIFSGLLVCFRNFTYYAFDLSKAPSRSPSDSIAEAETSFTARDGFVENYKDNLALIRTRVRDSNLSIDSYCIGRRSKTNVSLLYLKDIHNEEIRQEIEKVLKKIDIDAVLAMDDIASYFQKESTLNLFPCYQYLGSPDLACRRLYNGEFLIVIDRISTVIALPITLSISSKMSIDGLNVPIFSFFERFFVLLSLFLSTIFLGLVASFTTFQSDSLTLRTLSILKITQNGVMFPILFEILIVLGLLELFYLIGFRQAKVTVSSTVVLIGGLIIGDNLVTSGVAGVMIISLTAICFLTSFIVSSNVTVLMVISILRLFTLLSAFFFGLLGVTFCSILIIFFLYKQKTFGVHYFYPFVPFDLKGIRKFFMPTTSLKDKTRDQNLKIKNKRKRGTIE